MNKIITKKEMAESMLKILEKIVEENYPKQEWVGLTYEEVQEILLDPKFQLKPLIAHAVEAKLKEKNT